MHALMWHSFMKTYTAYVITCKIQIQIQSKKHHLTTFRSLFPTGSTDQLELKHTLMHWLANAYETSINQLALTVLYLSSGPVEHDWSLIFLIWQQRCRWLAVRRRGWDMHLICHPSSLPFKMSLSPYGRSRIQLSTNTTNICHLYGPQILIGLLYVLCLKHCGCLLIAVV